VATTGFAAIASGGVLSCEITSGDEMVSAAASVAGVSVDVASVDLASVDATSAEVA
jgi:hypothetical protein